MFQGESSEVCFGGGRIKIDGETTGMVAADSGLDLCRCVVITGCVVTKIEQDRRRLVAQDEGTIGKTLLRLKHELNQQQKQY